ncbi:unnamed protein product [Didymodactylos carnosus]|uniref:NAD(P)(+)--arginine ADP-ribosyltransferase n=1 Tax=Didymodactylos carnosus TaxID=1234261 RepID=A0A8S2F2X6_9BILA|nr:unnamed protein product [Didymodactylos carnosus]CAF4149796.1 unnamed protein product [Didymodactylos carnosus]
MISVCRHFYKTDPVALKKIDEFNEVYQPNDAVKWYTKPSFLCKLLNSSVRTENTDALFFFRFIIADLHYQLVDLHRNEPHHRTRTVFRGQTLRKEEFHRLKPGLVVSFNGFLSTSEDKNVAELFMKETTEEKYRILWKIVLPNEKTKIICADISALSEIQDESEILFSIGTQFEIETIEQMQRETYITISLVPYYETNPLVIGRFAHLKKNLDTKSPVLGLCTILLSLREYEKVERLSKRLLLKLPADHPELSAAYSNLGIMYNELGQGDQAFAMHLKAAYIEQSRVLQIIEQYGSEAAIKREEAITCVFSWVSSMIRLALLHVTSNGYDNARTLLIKCNRWTAPLKLEASPIYGPIIGRLHLAAGHMYGATKDFALAHHSFLLAKSIFTECGDELGVSEAFRMRGDAYVQLGGNDEIPGNDEPFGHLDYAREDYRFSLYFAASFVDSDDPCLLPAYEGQGNVDMLLDCTELAIANFEKCRDILLAVSNIANPRLIIIYAKLGFTHSQLNQQAESLENWTNACNVLIEQHNFSFGLYLNETKQLVLDSYIALRKESEGQRFLDQYFKYLWILIHYTALQLPLARMTVDDFKLFTVNGTCLALKRPDGSKCTIIMANPLTSRLMEGYLVFAPMTVEPEFSHGPAPYLAEMLLDSLITKTAGTY